MKRVVILGRGGAGKSTAATQLGKITQIPVIELDKYFWQPGLLPTPIDEWKQVQHNLTARSQWIMDGDLGKYDVLGIRLRAADTVLVLDFSLTRCFLRAVQRSPERGNFWWWLFTWRWLSRPKVMKAIDAYATKADVHILRTPKALEKFLSGAKP